MQTLKFLVLFGWVAFFSCAGTPAASTEKLKWMSLEEAVQNLKTEQKPVLIDLYTDWCGWCKVMDRRTYTNKHVREYIEQHFYPVKVNAETRQNIEWNGKTFLFDNDYKANGFAVYLTGGRLAFPTTVIIPSPGAGPQAIPGFLAPNELEVIVKYFGDGYDKKMPFEQFRKTYKATW